MKLNHKILGLFIKSTKLHNQQIKYHSFHRKMSTDKAETEKDKLTII